MVAEVAFYIRDVEEFVFVLKVLVVLLSRLIGQLLLHIFLLSKVSELSQWVFFEHDFDLVRISVTMLFLSHLVVE